MNGLCEAEYQGYQGYQDSVQLCCLSHHEGRLVLVLIKLTCLVDKLHPIPIHPWYPWMTVGYCGFSTSSIEIFGTCVGAVRTKSFGSGGRKPGLHGSWCPVRSHVRHKST